MSPTAVGNGYCLDGHPTTPPVVMLRAVGPYGNLYAQVPTACGLNPLAHWFTVRKFCPIRANSADSAYSRDGA